MLKDFHRTAKNDEEATTQVLLAGLDLEASSNCYLALINLVRSGEKTGDAIADMLFGLTNPSAKLPFSFPQSVGHLPVFYNHLPTDKGFYRRPRSLNKPGRDYVFSSPAPLWSFGYGLSYTTFEYLDARFSSEQLRRMYDCYRNNSRGPGDTRRWGYYKIQLSGIGSNKR